MHTQDVMKVIRHRPKGKKSLDDFDLTPEALALIIGTAHAERARLGPLFPANARGLTFYFHVINGLREHLLRRQSGWKVSTDHGLEFVEHEQKNVRLGYVLGDAGTGSADDEPRSMRRRGAASLHVAAQNMQMLLTFPEEYLSGRKPTPNDAETWFLVVNRGVRAYQLEIALPVSVEDRFFVGWSQRILIGELPLDTEPKFDDGTPPLPPPPKPIARRRKKGDAATDKKAVAGNDT